MALDNLAGEIYPSVPGAPAARLAEADYRSFADALGASDRGRAFLHEYARRNRHADTEIVLAALSRLEQTARAHRAEPEAERIRQDLRALLETLRGAKPQIDSSPGAIKAATLAAMLEFVQARLEALISPRTTLEQVPVPDQPELPIPQPSPMPTVLALVQAAMAAPPPRARSPLEVIEAESNVTALKAEAAAQARLNQIIPEVSFFDNVATPTPVETPAETTAEKPLEKPAEKPKVEPYELWLDPGLAEPPKPETGQAKAPEPILPPQDQAVVAQVEADLMASVPPEAMPEIPAAVATPKPATPRPATALAALAASFIKTEEGKPVAPATPPTALQAATPVIVAEPAAMPAAAAKAAPPKADDPLALIMALSEAERLALFT